MFLLPSWNPCWTSWFLPIHVCKKGKWVYTCNSNIKYQNCNLYVEKEIWKDFLIRMETRYNWAIQSSGIVQNSQMICINLLLTPPGNSILFDLNWKGLEIYGWKSAELLFHCYTVIWSPTIWIKTGKRKRLGLIIRDTG